MAPEITGRRRPTKPKKQARTQKRKRDDVDVEKLEAAVNELDVKAEYASFADIPLSAPTSEGLKSAHFSTLTDIQAKAIPLALKGGDILGAAKTGSGKTLAFLVPVLENLYRAQCIGADAGLGAMIVSPTRELAIQIFDVLKKIGGKGHLFAAGLIIGGKGLREERDALARMNIVVCTPGRMLQHLSQTSGFSVDNLSMLVLDEADRIMDMGFKKDVDAIIEYLPPSRQTLLFSATQTKRVSDLSRLALKDPAYISVHSDASTATPQTLQQNYILTPLPEKLDTLWSFLQTSKNSKTLVFLSSGKQVRYVYETFRHLRPGIPLLHLHGRQKQSARLEITQRFSRAKHACLFATDVVARGLDFPAVDWVIQVDCPEDADTYIHRVGRTARYEKAGRAVLFLDPSEEEGMLRQLELKRVPIERVNVREKKQTSIKTQLEGMCLHDRGLRYLGQKAFTSYVRSLHVQKDREVFRLENYQLEEYAASLGLPGAPRIKFLKADEGEVKRRKNAPRMVMALSGSEDEGEGEEEGVTEQKASGKNAVRTKYDRMFERQNQDILTDHYTKLMQDDDDDDDDVDLSDDDEDFLARPKVKHHIPDLDPTASSSDTEAPTAAAHKTLHLPGLENPLVVDSNRRAKLLKSKKKLLKFKGNGSKLVFDDDGNAHQIYELKDLDDFKASGPAEEQRRLFAQEGGEKVREADVEDKVLAREKKRVKREKMRERERAEAEAEDEEGMAGVQVGIAGVAEDGMANFIADARDLSEEEQLPPKKKQTKWFQKDVAPQGREEREIETLDDLEAEAARLLG